MTTTEPVVVITGLEFLRWPMPVSARPQFPSISQWPMTEWQKLWIHLFLSDLLQDLPDDAFDPAAWLSALDPLYDVRRQLQAALDEWSHG